jgi:hypothetical protein
MEELAYCLRYTYRGELRRPLMFGTSNRRPLWIGASIALAAAVLASWVFFSWQAQTNKTSIPLTQVKNEPPSVITMDSGGVAIGGSVTSATLVMGERKKALEALPKGNIAVHAPTTMKISEKRIVEAEIGLNVPKLHEGRMGGQTVEGTLRISPEMVAILTGAGFEIKGITPEQQPIAEGFPTAWSWYVEAKESGEQDLEATLYALVGDKAERMRIASYTHKISVSVREQTWREWLEGFSKEMGAFQAIFVALGAITTPILAWFGISLSRRRKRAASTTVSSRSPHTPEPVQ